MSKVSTKIAKNYRYFFYFCLSVCVFSGSGFWLLRNFAMREGDFGPESHPLQYPFLQLHGLAAFLMLLCLGAILASHVTKNWSSKRGKYSGYWLLTTVCFSMLSAYSLYYLVSDDWHVILGNSHAIIGISLPILLVSHIQLARKPQTKKRKMQVNKRQKKLALNNET